MSKALHSYYLQQMGIETWITRKPVIQQTKLWVISKEFDAHLKARSLFNKMLSSIGLLPDDFCMKSGVSEQLFDELKRSPPKLMLAIDHKLIYSLLNTDQPLMNLRSRIHIVHNVPVIVSYSPIDLLQHPIDKKRCYQDLLFVQKLLAQSA